MEAGRGAHIVSGSDVLAWTLGAGFVCWIIKFNVIHLDLCVGGGGVTLGFLPNKVMWSDHVKSTTFPNMFIYVY